MGEYNKRHGGPYDRGSADSHYRRPANPHYYRGATYASTLVEEKDMTEGEILAYLAGYEDNEKSGCFKEWD